MARVFSRGATEGPTGNSGASSTALAGHRPSRLSKMPAHAGPINGAGRPVFEDCPDVGALGAKDPRSRTLL